MLRRKNLTGMLTALLVPALFVITATSMWGMQQQLVNGSLEEVVRICNKSLKGKNLVNEWLSGFDQGMLDTLMLKMDDEKPSFDGNISFSGLFKIVLTNKFEFKGKNINGVIFVEFSEIALVNDEKRRTALISGLAQWFASKKNDCNFDLPTIFKRTGNLLISATYANRDHPVEKTNEFSQRVALPARLLLALYDRGEKELAKKLFGALEKDKKKTESVPEYTQDLFCCGVFFACADIDTLAAEKSVQKARIKKVLCKVIEICGKDFIAVLSKCIEGESHILIPAFKEGLEEIINEKKSMIEKFFGSDSNQNDKSQNNKLTTNNKSDKQSQSAFVVTSDNIVTLILSGIAGLFAPKFKGATPVLLGLGTVAGGYSATNVDKKWAWPTICAGTAFVANLCRHYVVPALFYSKTPGNRNRIKTPKSFKPFNKNGANNSF